MLKIFFLLVVFVSALGNLIHDNFQSLSILLFSSCFESRIREILTVMNGLAEYPGLKLTLAINSKCDLVHDSQKFELLRLPSSIDSWDHMPNFSELPTYLQEYSLDLINFFTAKWKNEKKLPDLIVTDVLVYAGTDLCEIFNIPNVIISETLYLYHILSSDSVFQEYLDFQHYEEKLNFSYFTPIRAYHYLKKWYYKSFEGFSKQRNLVREKFALGTIESSKFRSAVLIENFFGFEEARSLQTNVQMIGFLDENYEENEGISRELENWIENGVVYVEDMRDLEKNLEKLWESMSEIRFLVDSDNNTPKINAKNVMVRHIKNKPELFRTGKVLLNINQGDLTYIKYSVFNLVPILCLPFEKYQYYNCEIVESKKIGLKSYQMSQIRDIQSKINELLSSPIYKESLQKLKKMLNLYNANKKSSELIITFAKVGYSYLVPRIYELAWYQQKEIDIFVCYLLFLYMIWVSVKYFCFSNQKNKQKIE